MKARIQKVLRNALVSAVLSVFALPAFAVGGISTDSSLGMPAVSFSPAFGGPEQVVIPQSAGRTVGHNLFQSFSDFNIGKGQTVTFEELQQGFLNNVIARVTGKETSIINGTLRVTPGGHANFYLLNPNGVLFGDGARIDVPGDFHVTTASYLKFQDGAKYGTEPVTSKLTSSSPAALGFTASNHVNNVLISLSGDALLESKNEKTSIDVVGSEIRIENGASIESTHNGADIRLVAFKDVGEVSVLKGKEGYLPLPKASPSGRAGDIVIAGDGKQRGLLQRNNESGHIGLWGGNISLKDGGIIVTATSGSVAQKGSGGIDVHAQNLMISAKGDGRPSGVFSNNFGSLKGESINLSVDQDLTLKGNAQIYSKNMASGVGGGINIRSTNIDMSAEPDYSSLIGSYATNTALGGSGQITIINKDNISISGSSNVFTQTLGGSDSGNIKIDTRSLSLIGNDPDHPASIQTSAQEGSTGSSGRIDLLSRGSLSLEGNANILSTTYASGNSGALRIQSGSITLIGNNPDKPASIETSARVGSTGSSGRIDLLNRGRLWLEGNAQLFSYTQGPGQSGDLRIQSGSTTLIGNDPINAASIQTSAQEGSTGSSGRIDLLSRGTLRLEGNANILSTTYGSGNSGALKIQSGSITLIGNNPDKAASIETSARVGSTGSSGRIDLLNRGRLWLEGNAQLFSFTRGPGQSGDLRIQSGSTTLIGNDPSHPAFIQTSALEGSTGSSGRIDLLNRGRLWLEGNAQLFSFTRGPGQSGDLRIQSGSTTLIGNDPSHPAFIQTSAQEGSTGSSGRIDLLNRGRLWIDGYAGILSFTRGPGQSGDLRIQSGSTTLIGNDPINAASIQTSAQEGSMGSSGRIDLLSRGTLRLEGNANVLSTTFGSGNSGDLRIQSGSTTLIGNNPDKPATIETSARVGPTGSSGNSGDIDLISRILSVKGNSGIITGTKKGASGKSGDIRIKNQVTYLRELSYGQPFIETTSSDKGSSGSILITGGGLLKLDGTSGIATISNATGKSGDIRIDKDNVILSGRFSDKAHTPVIKTTANAEGDSGDIRIMAKGSLRLDQHSLIETTSMTGSGTAGNVRVLAGNLLIRDTGIGERGFIDRGITSTSRGPGDGGDVDIRVANDVLIISRYRYVPSFEPNDKNTSQLGIMTRAYGSGDAGDVSIKAGGDILFKGTGKMPSISPYDYFASADYFGVIQSATKDNATGDVGSVTIQSGGRLGIDSFYIRTENEPQSRSLAGNISLNSMNGIFMRHGLVRINSYGGSKLSPARPAQLLVDANKDFMMFRSGVYANAYQEGQTAADIRIHSGRDVVVSSDPLYRGGISSIGDNDAKGGNVTLEAQNAFALIHSGFGSDSYVKNSLEHTLPIGVNVDIAAGGIFLDDGKIYVYSGDDAVSLSRAHLNIFSYGLFPSLNHLNGRYFYTREGLSTLLYPGPKTNEIGKFNKEESDYNFSLNGSLFGISGVLPSLSKAEFREDALSNACDTPKAGALLQSGKGGYRSGLEWNLLH